MPEIESSVAANEKQTGSAILTKLQIRAIKLSGITSTYDLSRHWEGALFWALAVAVPPIVIVSTHVWLRTAYTGGGFDPRGFVNLYGGGIYRYRIAGREIVLFIYRHLTSRLQDRPLTMPRGPEGSWLLYMSYVILNAICFSVTNFLLLHFLSDRRRKIRDPNLALYLYLTLIQALAMAVVTPYDQLAYALLLTSLLATTLSTPAISYCVLGVTAIAGALTRETQFLATPALIAVALFTHDHRSRRLWNSALYNLGIFAATYVTLRVLTPGTREVAGGWTGGGKWAAESFVILAILTYVSTILCRRVQYATGPTATLLVLSVPYLAPIAMSGVLRELRLIVPILLAQAFVYSTGGLRTDAAQTPTGANK